ncbi:hypothetical protein [Clostridium thailandense]|uniref:hypothetical protein n=1 Tax=Clostridium thailandense TaxID=2794346 RepID=UPI0039899C0F
MSNLQTTNLSQLGMIILIFGYVIYRQFALRPVKSSRYVILPIILLFFTVKAIISLGGDLYKEAAPIILLASIGIVSGLASGMITKIFTGDDGILYQKGGVAAVILLLFTIPTRLILKHSILSLPGGAVLQSAGISSLIVVSSQVISRSLTVLARCPQVWSLYLEHRKSKRELRGNKKNKAV